MQVMVHVSSAKSSRNLKLQNFVKFDGSQHSEALATINETSQHSIEIDNVNLSLFLHICFASTSYGMSCFSAMMKKKGVCETASE